MSTSAAPFSSYEEKTGRNYLAQSGFIGDKLPNHKTVWQLEPGDYVLKPGQDRVEVRSRRSRTGWR